MESTDPQMRIVMFFDQDKTAGAFLREDGEGGFAGAVYRMAREIDRLRAGIKRLSDEEELCAETTGDDPFSLIYLAAKLAKAEAENEQLRSDAKLLDAIQHESWDLRCFNIPTGGDDCDIGWSVIGHWQTEPHERVVAEVYVDDPRTAIRTALSAPKKDD